VALDEGNLAVVQALLAKGADVDVSRSDGYTALMVAVSQAGSVKMVQALIDKGADVNAKANDSATALTLASKNSHLDVAQLLRTAGAK
jgi:ankyrin repeat protein